MSAQPGGDPRPGRGEVVLIVEDEDSVRRFATRTLTGAGYVVRAAAGGEEALELLAGGPIDLLLTDLIVPGMLGPDVAANVRAWQPRVMVLYVSSHGDRVLSRRSLAETAAGCIEKPYTAGQLIAKVSETFDECNVRTAVLRTGAEQRSAGDARTATPRLERLLRAVLEENPALIHVKDLEGRYLLYNRRFAEAFALAGRAAAEGVPAGEVLLGRDDIWLDPTRARVWSEHDTRARGGPLEVEELFEHPHRGRVGYRSIRFPLLDRAGAVYATCGVAIEAARPTSAGDRLEQSGRESTGRREAEHQLAETEWQARQVLETTLEAFIAMDAGGLITGWNAGAEAVFGWSREDVVGRELAEVLIPEARREAHRSGIARFLATNESRMLDRRVELVVVHRNGYEFLAEMAVSAIETEHGWSFAGFLRDITERERTERELVLATDVALNASRMKSMFLANMSHEIRTPMNGVIGMTELLLDTELSDEQRAYVETISASGEALLSVIDDILDVSKAEAGMIELDPTEFDLAEAIERVCTILGPRAEAKGIELVVSLDPGVPTRVLADAGRLRQVVTNLVANAIKFTMDGRVVVRVGAYRTDGSELVRVTVTDTGIGMEPAVLRRVFEPFQQADTSTTRRYGGTGLGLAISRRLATLMGGSVGAESEPGKGSTFWLEVPLPRAPAGGAETRSDRTGDARPARERSALLILVVEDTPVNRAVASGLLVKCGFMAHTANNGSEALEAISTDSYDAVLMDCQMPVMDGYEATREIRRRERGGKRRIPIIAMTANSTEAERQRCLAVGMDDFLSKPLRKQLLEETLERWLTASSTGTPEAGAPGPDTATARLGATRWELLDDEVLAELEALGEGMLGELLSEYFDGVERDLAELDTVIGRGEAFTAARIAHRLKGGSATIGARRVSELAADLEATAKAGDDRSAAALLDVIRSSLRETRAALLDRGLSTR